MMEHKVEQPVIQVDIAGVSWCHMLVSALHRKNRLGDEAMSLIVTELYDALIDAGASEEKARAAAAAMPVIERLATKDDIADVKRELAVVKLGTFTMGPAILALLVKLTFFP